MRKVVNDSLDRRYSIKRLQICPFEKIKCGEANLIHPLRNEGYGFVLCVCDLAHERVIEIVNGHSYKYIELVSGFMLNKKRIIDKKRYAICPLDVSDRELSSEEIDRIKIIMDKLDNEKEKGVTEFIDGNYIMINEEYKKSIESYESVKEIQKKRIKR